MIDALTKWNAAFPGVPLVAHLLRETFADRWLRIHSLPDSKRYASCESEYAELLRRQTIALSDIIGRASVIFVTEPDKVLLEKLTTAAETTPICVQRLAIGKIDVVGFEDSAAQQIYACKMTLIDNRIDFLMRMIADDELRNTIIVNPNFTHICHPYDGGMDLILSDSPERDSYRKRYSGWLSLHPKGL